MVNQDTLTEIVNSLKTTEKQTDHTYQAVVSRIEKDGSVWVNIAGSDQDTPTEAVSTEVKRGDAVTVEWRNNKLYVAGNYSSPSAGIERVMEVDQKATNALTDATVAHEAAVMAVDSAGVAGRAASVAQTAAEAAQATANSKKRVFTSQPVPPYSVGDLWVDTSGGVQNGDSLGYGGDAYSALVGTGQVGYMVVGGVSAESESVVYVCTFARLATESFNANDWQLAATDDGAVDELREWFWHDANGAHILGDVSGYRNDITSTGMKIMDTSTETSVAEFGGSGAQIGQTGSSHSIIDADGQRFYADDGIKTFEVVSSGAQKTVTKHIDAYVYPDTVSSYNLSPVPETGGTITLTGGISLATVWSGTYGTAYSGTAQEPLGGLLYTINYDGATSLSISAQTSYASGCFISYPFVMYTPVYSLGTRADDDDASGFSTAIGEGLYASSENQTVIGKYNQKDTSDDYALVVGVGSGENSRSDGLEFDWSGNLWIRNNIKAEGSITVGGHSSAVGTVLSNTWTATSNSASGTSMTGTIDLTPGTWMLGMITPTCSASIAYYFTNLSSALTYPYFNMGTGGSGWVPVVITANTTTRVASGASTSVTYSNTARGRIFAIRIV